MKLWIAAAVLMAILSWLLIAYLIATTTQKPQVTVSASAPALESRVTALEDEVRRLARDRAKECGRMR
jgi:hypothetical protein